MKKNNKLIPFLVILMLSCSIYHLSTLNRSTVNFEPIEILPAQAREINIVEQESVRDMIIRLSLDSKVPTDTALRIADCESKMGTQMENPNSSAKGVYQFIKQTWLYSCGGGDVMNNELNIKCFLKLYPEHQEWWECK